MISALLDNYFSWLNNSMLKICRIKIPKNKSKRTSKHYIIMVLFWIMSTFFAILFPALIAAGILAALVYFGN